MSLMSACQARLPLMTGLTPNKLVAGVKRLVPLALLALAACTTPFKADVSRFQQMPAPQGQSFTIVASDPAKTGSIEFDSYAGLVASRLAQYGYVAAAEPGKADMVVNMDYSVDQGVERRVYDYDPFFYGPSFYRPFIVRGPHGRAYIHGYYDPFLWGGYGFSGYSGMSSYTLFQSELSLKIDSTTDNRRLFEGVAQARSRSNRMTYLVPNLVEALFTGFPGNNGETVRISVAPEKN